MDIDLLLRSIMTMLIVVFGLFISFLIFSANKKSTAHRWLLLGIVFSILFILFDYLTAYTSQPLSLYLIRTSFGLAPLVICSLYFFVIYFPTRSKQNILITSLVVCYTFIFSILSFFTNFVVANTHNEGWGTQIINGGLSTLYVLFSIFVVLIIIIITVSKYQKSNNVDKQKIGLFLFGVVIFSLAEVLYVLIFPLINLDKYSYFGDYSIMIFFGFTAYAIIKHHLFDVRLAIVRSVTYTLVLVTLAAIYLVIAFVISAVFNSGQTSTSQIVSGVAISLLLAFIFQPIKRFFDRITNRIFYKDNYDINDFFARLNKSLSTTTDLRGLLERVAYEIGHTLKGEQAFFYINTDNGHYITAGTPHHKQLPKIDALKIGEVHDGEREVIVASMLENDDPMRRLMISHRIELILPLVKEDKIIGYLCLGDHLTSGYTNRDIRALYTISDELVIAIQNALAVHEIRELNATLQQKVNNATKELRSSNLVLRQLDKVKDEFISMASHQLRTPLTSVKGYISMVIEGDAGKITNPQKKLLEEAFMSSERMVHLINDFLNVSRIQTGKFIIEKSPVDLSKLVSEELDSLRPNATARGLKFNYKPPKKFPIMELDEGKMRQVIMNYADNAIYYTSENSIIYINLSIDNNEALFTVKDTGIGVPVKEREHLFSKFYRASNARVRRPDGTGVGIYLAKKVINALGGKVVFESVEGKGSTFGFRLPIPSQKNEKTNK